MGMRFSVIPGARILNAVVINDTATASDATSVKVISWAHTSARLLGVYKLSDSGGYENHPTSGPALSRNETYKKMPPNRNIQ